MAGCWLRLTTLALLWLTTIANRGHTSSKRNQAPSCNASWYGYSGQEEELSSPNFPSHYNGNDTCVWTIQDGDENSRVVLTFHAFMLEDSQDCQEDFVEIAETSQPRYRLCGKRSEFQVVSKSNNVTVLFQSDGENQFPGFKASFKVVPASQVQSNTAVSHSTSQSPSDRQSNSSSDASGKYDGCQCGEESSTKDRRIVGGNIVQENKFPWLVVLVTTDHQTSAHCGGVLLTPRHVMTAAHCTKRRVPEDYLAVAGAYNLLERQSETYTQRNVVKFTPHERYNGTTEENDIAILELDKPFELSPAIQTICLPDKTLGDLVGETTVTAGWGKVTYMGESSSHPRAVELPVVTNKECARAFSGTDGHITQDMLCAGTLDGSVDACQGDSGGPLMWLDKEKGRWMAVGIVSFGVRCATPGFYGVYTRVSHYPDWILTNVPEAKCNLV